MDDYKDILASLERFTKRYYTKVLLRGVLLFVTLSFLLVLGVLGVEYFLWLPSWGRLLLLLLGIGLLLLLLLKYILGPLLFLFQVRRGISFKEAAVLIGLHFPEVSDRLLNLLDLSELKGNTDLIVASVDQRSRQLKEVPFYRAVKLSDGFSKWPYLFVPIGIVILIWISGNSVDFFNSYNRVWHYDEAYLAPAPFEFVLLSDSLRVIDDGELLLRVTTLGNVVPDGVQLWLNGSAYTMRSTSDGFEYSVNGLDADTFFYFEANGVRSQRFQIDYLRSPSIRDFALELQFPKYLKRSKEVVHSTGNAIIPEGTEVNWHVVGKHIDEVSMHLMDSVYGFNRDNDVFSFKRVLYEDAGYRISTSNKELLDFELLDYQIRAIKDRFPTMEVDQVIDSLNTGIGYFSGVATDDYGLNVIRVVFYPEGSELEAVTFVIDKPLSNFGNFFYTFPPTEGVYQAGVTYELYFEVVDNDGIHGGKVSRSQVFKQRVLSETEWQAESLGLAWNTLSNLTDVKDMGNQQRKLLQEMQINQKEARSLGFEQQSEIKNYFSKQLEQERRIEEFSDGLRERLKSGDRNDRSNALLQERLERQELEARKNQKAMEELLKIADKLDKDSLAAKLEELANKQNGNQRGLEQLVELTRRYYVSERAAQLARRVKELEREQRDLAPGNSDINKEVETQRLINESFKEVISDLEELRKDNNALKRPAKLPDSGQLQEDIKRDQREAIDILQDPPSDSENSEDKADKKQRSAAEKLAELSKSLDQGASMGGENGMVEDAESLRQILDNLLLFSFKQEDLLQVLKKDGYNEARISESVRRQQELRTHFEHVDDSLFSLSLRRAELSEFVNEQISGVYYNMDKAMERLVEGQIYQGTAYQQYTLHGANGLADFLVDILDNMQQSLQSGKGKGKGDGFQLPDIILGQNQLSEQLGKMGSGKRGSNGARGKGNNGAEGQGESKDGGEGGRNEGRKGGDGQSGGGSSGLSETHSQEIYEIYKQQQFLKEQLEWQLNDLINNDDRKIGEKLIRQMEDFQNELIGNGITEYAQSMATNIRYELLKLNNASMRQREVQERESSINNRSFRGPLKGAEEVFRNYSPGIDVLRRQGLPLHKNFREKVKVYFEKDD